MSHAGLIEIGRKGLPKMSRNRRVFHSELEAGTSAACHDARSSSGRVIVHAIHDGEPSTPAAFTASCFVLWNSEFETNPSRDRSTIPIAVRLLTSGSKCHIERQQQQANKECFRWPAPQTNSSILSSSLQFSHSLSVIASPPFAPCVQGNRPQTACPARPSPIGGVDPIVSSEGGRRRARISGGTPELREFSGAT